MEDKQISKILEKALMAGVIEQRRARRWKIFFLLLIIAYIAVIAFSVPGGVVQGYDTNRFDDHIAVVNLSNEIIGKDYAINFNKSLKKAFENENVKGVIIRINSPGGSPVQSSIIYEYIWDMRDKFPDKPVYSVIEDLGASGAYLIACATEKIYADATSFVGSIGAVFGSFGAVDLIDKIGLQRRLIVSGKYKAAFDPFSPINDSEIKMFQTMVDDVHQVFINAVRRGRGDRVKISEESDLYTGRVWLGVQALPIGLIDGIGHVSSVIKEDMQGLPEVDYTRKPPMERLMERLEVSFSRFIGTALSKPTLF